MTDRVTKRDFEPTLRYKGVETEVAKIQALGLLAISQAIDSLTEQFKRAIDEDELPPRFYNEKSESEDE